VGLILGGSFAFAVGGAFMKASHGFTRFVPSACVVMFFAVGAAFLARAMTTENMSSTVVVGLGIEAVLTVVLGMLLLGDRITPAQFAGLLFILGGVVLVRH
jgi:multidrug transporter EmrE-like cation transporter